MPAGVAEKLETMENPLPDRVELDLHLAKIGAELRRLREEKKLSVHEVGKQIGEWGNTVSRAERGLGTEIRILVKLASYFGLELQLVPNPNG